LTKYLFHRNVRIRRQSTRWKGVLVIDFDGQVAVVTGAGRGLGRLYALELARRGAKVIVNDLGGSMHGDGADASVADSVVEEVVGLAGVSVAPDSPVDLTGFARPVWREGRCVLLVQQAAAGLVPFEARVQVPCCSAH